VNHNNTQATTKQKNQAWEGHEHRSAEKNISQKQVAAGVALCQGNASVMSHCPLKCDQNQRKELSFHLYPMTARRGSRPGIQAASTGITIMLNF
jgi:hypothetical protein